MREFEKKAMLQENLGTFLGAAYPGVRGRKKAFRARVVLLDSRPPAYLLPSSTQCPYNGSRSRENLPRREATFYAPAGYFGIGCGSFFLAWGSRCAGPRHHHNGRGYGVEFPG